MEIWVDPNDDGNWVNVNNFVDSGGWRRRRVWRYATNQMMEIGLT